MKRIGLAAFVAFAVAGVPALSYAVCSSAAQCGSTGAGRCCAAEGQAAVVVCEADSACASSPTRGGAIGIDDEGPCAEPTDDGTVPDVLNLQDCEGAASPTS